MGINVYLLRDSNARVGVDRKERLMSPFGVGNRNINGENLVEVCVENRLIIENT